MLYEMIEGKEVIGRFEVDFVSVKHSPDMAEDARALVLMQDGSFQMAYWLGEKHGWCDAGSFENCGGIGGDITTDVVGFSKGGMMNFKAK